MRFSYLPWFFLATSFAYGATSGVGLPSVCQRSQTLVRKEWGNMSPWERKAYTDAVLCLQGAPSQLSHALYNTTSRYEDFTAIHINYTRLIHNNGVFLAWHRSFITLFENALRDECGYKGALSYIRKPRLLPRAD